MTLTITINALTNNNLATTTECTKNITAGNHSKKAEYLAFKLDHLKNKAGRYSSHHLFFMCCISENLQSNGLKLELKPTIGNHDEDFLNNRYKKLQQYLLDFLKDVTTFYQKNKTKYKTNTKYRCSVERIK